MCHEANGKCSLDEITCKLMNNCTNHGQCVTGKCICNKGYYGADCSIVTELLDTTHINLNATTWKYLELGSNINKMKVHLKSNNGPVTVYTRKESVPSQTFFDWFIQSGTDNELEFYVSKEGSGSYIALFNPDLDNSISVDIGVSNESKQSSMYWLFIVFSCFFAILSIVNFAYF